MQDNQNQNQNYGNHNQQNNMIQNNNGNWQNTQGHNYNNENWQYNQNYNYGNRNWQDNRNFLDKIIEKDENNLFLKTIFGISLIMFLNAVWLGYKAYRIKILGEKITSLDRLSGGMGMQESSIKLFVEEFSNLSINLVTSFSRFHKIVIYGTIILVIVLVLSYIKMKREGYSENFKGLNYMSALILSGLGIYEIMENGKYVDSITLGPTNMAERLGKAIMGEQVAFPDFEGIKIFVLCFIAVSLFSTLINYFKLFRNRNLKIQDFMGKNQNYYNQNYYSQDQQYSGHNYNNQNQQYNDQNYYGQDQQYNNQNQQYYEENTNNLNFSEENNKNSSDV